MKNGGKMLRSRKFVTPGKKVEKTKTSQPAPELAAAEGMEAPTSDLPLQEEQSVQPNLSSASSEVPPPDEFDLFEEPELWERDAIVVQDPFDTLRNTSHNVKYREARIFVEECLRARDLILQGASLAEISDVKQPPRKTSIKLQKQQTSRFDGNRDAPRARPRQAKLPKSFESEQQSKPQQVNNGIRAESLSAQHSQSTEFASGSNQSTAAKVTDNASTTQKQMSRRALRRQKVREDNRMRHDSERQQSPEQGNFDPTHQLASGSSIDKSSPLQSDP